MPCASKLLTAIPTKLGTRGRRLWHAISRAVEDFDPCPWKAQRDRAKARILPALQRNDIWQLLLRSECLRAILPRTDPVYVQAHVTMANLNRRTLVTADFGCTHSAVQSVAE